MSTAQRAQNALQDHSKPLQARFLVRFATSISTARQSRQCLSCRVWHARQTPLLSLGVVVSTCAIASPGTSSHKRMMLVYSVNLVSTTTSLVGTSARSALEVCILLPGVPQASKPVKRAKPVHGRKRAASRARIVLRTRTRLGAQRL